MTSIISLIHNCINYTLISNNQWPA